MGIYLLFNSTVDENSYIKIKVEEGDSLWSISEQYAGQIGMKTIDLVNLIEKENQLYGETIKIGDEIYLPNIFLNKNEELELAFESE